MQSIASRTEGVLIVPQGTLSSKKTTFVYDKCGLFRGTGVHNGLDLN